MSTSTRKHRLLPPPPPASGGSPCHNAEEDPRRVKILKQRCCSCSDSSSPMLHVVCIMCSHSFCEDCSLVNVVVLEDTNEGLPPLPPPPAFLSLPRRRKRIRDHLITITNRYCCNCTSPTGALDVDCVNCTHRLCKDCQVVDEESFHSDLWEPDTEQEPHADHVDRAIEYTQQHPIPAQRQSQTSTGQQSYDPTIETARGFAKVQESDARHIKSLAGTRVLATERQCDPLVVQEGKKRRLNMVKCESCRRDKKKVLNTPVITYILQDHY
jgi:hypothetical protein